MIRFASFTVAALLLPCVPGARQDGQDSVPRKETVQAKEINDPDAYAVYRTLIPAEWPVRVGGAKRLVIQQETESRALSCQRS